ncbi:MAG: hypothetical protein U5L08_10725 [Xanthomonadales bacterium]|nr:hypothetical protein [Xanthomonadales bacterium]
MKRFNATTMTAGLLGLALVASAGAQTSQEAFPDKQTAKTSCESVDWNDNMLKNHPRLIDACQEVVMVDGQSWARFDAKFREIQRDGNVVFNVQNRRGRTVENVTLMPAENQVAYIDDRPTPFNRLRTTDLINLYVPEGQYGFSTQPGVPPEQVATVIAPEPVQTERAVARRDTRPEVLPATATALPWFALGGLLCMLTGVVLTTRRWI